MSLDGKTSAKLMPHFGACAFDYALYRADPGQVGGCFCAHAIDNALCQANFQYVHAPFLGRMQSAMPVVKNFGLVNALLLSEF